MTVPFGIKTTEAPHFQRVVWQREQSRTASRLPEMGVVRRRQRRAPRSVSDGNGFVFVDHIGHVCPSGFLPVQRGNIRTGDLAAACHRAGRSEGTGCVSSSASFV